MGKIGKISTLKKEYNNSQLQTMQGGLAAKGMTRIPGTGVFKYPYKELDGQYRTGSKPATGPPAVAPPLNPPVPAELTGEASPRNSADSRSSLSWFSSICAVTARLWESLISPRPSKSRTGAHLVDLGVGEGPAHAGGPPGLIPVTGLHPQLIAQVAAGLADRQIDQGLEINRCIRTGRR